MTINQAGIDLIKSFEGLRLTAYQDQVGVWTIGYGHTGADVTPGLMISEDDAERLLEADLQRFQTGVSSLVCKPLTPSQFAALVSFAYNLGISSLAKSTLLRCLNKGNYQDAAAKFLKWDRAEGVVVAGLLRRRQAEKTLFESQD